MSSNCQSFRCYINWWVLRHPCAVFHLVLLNFENTVTHSCSIQPYCLVTYQIISIHALLRSFQKKVVELIPCRIYAKTTFYFLPRDPPPPHWDLVHLQSAEPQNPGPLFQRPRCPGPLSLDHTVCQLSHLGGPPALNSHLCSKYPNETHALATYITTHHGKKLGALYLGFLSSQQPTSPDAYCNGKPAAYICTPKEITQGHQVNNYKIVGQRCYFRDAVLPLWIWITQPPDCFCCIR